MAAAAATAVAAFPCAAGVIRDDRADSVYRSYATQPQFAAVGSYSAGGLFGSFTLIAPQWALTAAHVVDANDDISDDTLRIGTQSRRPAQVFVPTGINGNPGWNGNINAGFDLALIRLEEPFSGITPAPLYTSFQELGKQVTQVGFGQGGTGSEGATTGSGIKRAGDNVVDRFVTFANGATGLLWDFDEPAPRTAPNYSGSATPLDLEYLIAPGDSGGGSFIFEDDTWYLAGVHSGGYNDIFNYPGAASNVANYGDAALITRVAAYQQFIYSHIPELATAAIPEPAALGCGAFAALLCGRRRRTTVTAR